MPSVFNPQVWYSPALTCVKVSTGVGGAVSVGVFVGVGAHVGNVVSCTHLVKELLVSSASATTLPQSATAVTVPPKPSPSTFAVSPGAKPGVYADTVPQLLEMWVVDGPADCVPIFRTTTTNPGWLRAIHILVVVHVFHHQVRPHRDAAGHAHPRCLARLPVMHERVRAVVGVVAVPVRVAVVVAVPRHQV